MPTAASVFSITHRRLPISPKPWDVQILKLNGLVNRYSQMKWIFSIEITKDKSLISFNRNSHAKMAPDSRAGGASSSGAVNSLPGPHQVFVEPSMGNRLGHIHGMMSACSVVVGTERGSYKSGGTQFVGLPLTARVGHFVRCSSH
jgi:hypothetical protein